MQVQVVKTCGSFHSAQRHNCIHIFMIYQLHALIVNYIHSVHLMDFSLCLLTLELNYKGKQTWQGSRWFLEWSEATHSRFLWCLWQKCVPCSWFYGMSLDACAGTDSSYSKTVSLDFTEKYLSLVCDTAALTRQNTNHVSKCYFCNGQCPLVPLLSYVAIRIKSCASRGAVHARQTYFWDRTMRGFANPTHKKKVVAEVIIIIFQCKTKHAQK